MAKPYLVNGVGSPQSIYLVSTLQHHPIGSRGVTDDGRVFYYGRYTASSALPAGKLAASAVLTTQHEDLDTATTSFINGTTKMTGITIGSTALTQDQYQYICVVDSTNAGTATTPGPEGMMFRIMGHGAYSASATDVQVELFDPVPISSDAGTQVSLLKSPYADFVIAPSSSNLNDVYAGIPQVNVPAGNSTTQYCWLQTYGPAAAWVAGTPAEGQPLMPDTTTNGNLLTAVATTGATPTIQPIVATQMGVDGTNNEVQAVFLHLRA